MAPRPCRATVYMSLSCFLAPLPATCSLYTCIIHGLYIIPRFHLICTPPILQLHLHAANSHSILPLVDSRPLQIEETMVLKKDWRHYRLMVSQLRAILLF
ncbi:hypothetical protein GOP47_0017384 [Adiantum capillus-veneris]|uniref:Uncharacterized protein n=1 Tax=Adiantum capillus-veneris TaxID=13818 RepID=A0A9D4UGH4_ADICA|nr:hypothetical protein GOP47_0017384 [Adiantum capillus-veneris]